FAVAAARIGKYQTVSDALFRDQQAWGASGKVWEIVAGVLTPEERKKVQTLATDPSVLADVQNDVDRGKQAMASHIQTPTLMVTYKLRQQPWTQFADYEVVPMWAAKFLAHTLPWFEVLVGLLLIVGRWFRTSTVSTSLLLLVFFSLMVRAFAGGKEINCGCFGPNELISWKTLVRDGSLLAVSLFLTAMAFRNRRTRA